MKAKKLKKWIAFVLAAVMLISSLTCMNGQTSMAAELTELTTEEAAEETTQTTSETIEVTTESTESEETGTEETTESVPEASEEQATEVQTTEAQTEQATMEKLENGALVFSAMTDSEKRELLLDLLEDKNEPGSREWLCNLTDEQVISIFAVESRDKYEEMLVDLLLTNDAEDGYVYKEKVEILGDLSDEEVEKIFSMTSEELGAYFEVATDSDALEEDSISVAMYEEWQSHVDLTPTDNGNKLIKTCINYLNSRRHQPINANAKHESSKTNHSLNCAHTVSTLLCDTYGDSMRYRLGYCAFETHSWTSTFDSTSGLESVLDDMWTTVGTYSFSFDAGTEALNQFWSDHTKAGDVVIFKYDGDPTHCGIAGGGSAMIADSEHTNGLDCFDAAFYLRSTDYKMASTMTVYRNNSDQPRPLRICKSIITSDQKAFFASHPEEYKNLSGADYGIYASLEDAKNKTKAIGYCYIDAGTNGKPDNVSQNMTKNPNGQGGEAYVPVSTTKIYIREITAPTSGLYNLSNNIYWANIGPLVTSRLTIGVPMDYNGNSMDLKSSQAGFYLDTFDSNFGIAVNNDGTSENTIADSPKYGNLAIKKVSTNPTAVANNKNYTLQGAKFGVYTSKADALNRTNAKYTLTTDANGNASVGNVPVGTYYVKELDPSKGYYVNNTVFTVNVTAGGTYSLEVKETPQMDPLFVLVTKEGDDGKKVAGALYTVKYYSVSMDTDPAKSGYTATKTWVFKTDSNGKINFSKDSQWYVSGDEFYLNKFNRPALPAGTVTVQETQAPEGYLIDPEVHTIQIIPGTNASVSTTNPVSIIEEQERGDISFYKKDEDGNPLANVKFQITDANGESHIVWTDENGYYSTKSSYIAHSKDTNSGESGCGVWFGTADVDDAKGALPYGTYTVKELRCEANKEKYKDIEAITFTITTNGEDKVLNDITNYDLPTISTTVRDAVTDTNVAALGDTLTFIDTVHGVNLEKDHKYTLTCKIWSKSDNDFLKDADGNEITATQEFTATDETMDVDVTATIDVTKNLIGQDIVCYEYLTDEAYPGETVASHEDVTDEGQTIHFPEIGTTAKDAKTYINEGMAEADAKIIDTVAYTNLVPGKTYTMIATIMNQGTNKPLTDADGNEITVTKEFVPDSSSGSVDVEITFDASLLAGENVTVFEDCTYNGHTVAIHADITDEGQTVHFPKIGTTAEDAVTGTREALADSATTLVDTVTYTNLIVGEEHTVKGTLHYTDTGEEVTDADGNVITSETTFTPETANGSVEVYFLFDASLLAGETITVFEDVYYKDREVASHADIEDEGQTVHFPGVSTTAMDAVSLTHYGKRRHDAIFVDKVSLSNLEIGGTYHVKGILMDFDTKEAFKDDKGNTIEAELTFTADDKASEQTLQYQLDSLWLLGKSLVCFEELYRVNEDGTESLVGVHKNIDDEGQTVTYDNYVGVAIMHGEFFGGGKSGSGAPRTGDMASPYLFLILGGSAAAAAIVLIIRRKKERSEKR